MNENDVYVFIHIHICTEREKKIVGRYNVSFACVFIYGYH